jgi:transposase
MMTASTQADTTIWSFPFSQAEWEQTPRTVQVHLLALQTQLHDLQQQHQQLQSQVDQLQGRLDPTSKTSSKPPSSDAPFTKPKRRGSSGKRGARPGHTGSGPILLEPTEVHVVSPASCACGHSELVMSLPYHTHQVIALPPIEMQITHFE